MKKKRDHYIFCQYEGHGPDKKLLKRVEGGKLHIYALFYLEYIRSTPAMLACMIRRWYWNVEKE